MRYGRVEARREIPIVGTGGDFLRHVGVEEPRPRGVRPRLSFRHLDLVHDLRPRAPRGAARTIAKHGVGRSVSIAR
jgi:hypothetical protein